MNCAQCNRHNAVISSRHTKLGIVRRRECLHCGDRWTTKEVSADRITQLLELEAKYKTLLFTLRTSS